MPGVRDSDRSARPRLPRQAKLPKTPPRPSHHRVTRATAPAPAFIAASYLSSPVSPDQSTESDDDESSKHFNPSSKKRKVVSSHDRPINNKRLRRTARISTLKVSYAESDSDIDLNDINGDNYDHTSRQDFGHLAGSGSPVKRRRRDRSLPARKRSKTSKTATFSKTKTVEETPVETNLRYPGNTLPYHAWCRVFDHIASPLLDPEARLEDVIQAKRELLKACSLGKLVYEPAMVALYRCPPVLNQRAFRLLSRTLSEQPANTLINYRPKVETLRIDVDHILHKKHGGSYLLLDDIVPYLPRLMDFELSHHFDKAPYRELDNTVRYKYPHNLFKLLDPLPGAVEERGDKLVSNELRSWTWNARLAEDVFPLNELKKHHLTPGLAELRKITFVNYQLPSTVSSSVSPEKEEDRAVTADLAAAIRALPHLEHLVFESSTVVDSKLLDLLPKTLKRLELINCWEVTSVDLGNFLCSHGSLLEELTLNHCFALSMGFTSVLEHACPKLTHLHMNLLYYKINEYSDSNPIYDVLLGPGEVPTWPASIQSIEIDYMRFSSVSVANTFFNSLFASASRVPNLRRLVLGAKLDVSFRERNNFRNACEKKMEKIFKRPVDSPVSIHNRTSVSPNNQHHDRKSPKIPARRSTRRCEHPPSPGSDSDIIARESTAKTKALAKQLQWRMRDTSASQYRDGDEGSEDELAGDPDGRSQLDPTFVHGLCEVVEIKIDNQKPTENQRSMEDFLDSESDGSDTEWGGDDSEREDPVVE